MGVFLLALALRLGYAFLAEQVDPFLRADALHGDAGEYDWIASNLVQGKGFRSHGGARRSFRPPLYPLFLAAVYRIFGRNLTAVRAVQAVLGAFACVISASIGDRLFGHRVAILTGVGTALHPLLIYFGAWIITDTLFIALFCLLILWALSTAERPTWGRIVVLGTLLGLATLTRPQVILILPLLMMWFSLVAGGTPKDRLVHVLLLAVFTALPLVPWTVRNYRIHDGWVFVSTQGGYTFYSANNPDAFGGHVPGFPPLLYGLSEIESDREYYRRGFQWIREDPRAFLSLLPSKLLRLWSPLQVNISEAEYTVPLAPAVKVVYSLFLLLALYGGLRFGARAVILWLPIVSFTLAGLIFYGGTRYALPMAPFVVILAAVGAASFGRLIPSMRYALSADKVGNPR